jgi:ribonuclease HI
METQTKETVDILFEIEPSYELLAVLNGGSRIREELATGRYGKHFVAFTDGSCAPHSIAGPEGRGGWATIIFGPRGERWELHGDIENTTNNRAEVCGLLAALASVPMGSHLGVQSDSRYLVDHVRAECRANDNDDLWLEIREMVVAKGINLSAAWVPGHSGNRHNERADALASVRK